MRSSLLLTSLSLTLLATATPFPFPSPQQSSLDTMPSNFTTNPNNLALTAIKDKSIECQAGNSKLKPHNIECVRAMLQLPTTPIHQEFGYNTDPPTLPFKAQSDRCIITIDVIKPGTTDESSWQYAQLMGIFLMSTCKYAFGQESRTAGNIIFGRNGELVMTIKKEKSGSGTLIGSGNATEVAENDDDDDEATHDPYLESLLEQELGNRTVTAVS